MTGTSNKTTKIVFIEDDIFLAKICGNHLLELGHDVTICNTANDGWRAIENQKPELILLDIIIPDMNGFELLKKIREHDTLRDTKVIILSNLGQPDDIKQGKDLGVLEYITKANTQLSEIASIVQKHI